MKKKQARQNNKKSRRAMKKKAQIRERRKNKNRKKYLTSLKNKHNNLNMMSMLMKMFEGMDMSSLSEDGEGISEEKMAELMKNMMGAFGEDGGGLGDILGGLDLSSLGDSLPEGEGLGDLFEDPEDPFLGLLKGHEVDTEFNIEDYLEEDDDEESECDMTRPLSDFKEDIDPSNQ
jgi:hypothetical protein